jgi:hypothetical protein
VRLASAAPAQGAAVGSVITVASAGVAPKAYAVQTLATVSPAEATDSVLRAPAGALVVLVPVNADGWTVLAAAWRILARSHVRRLMIGRQARATRRRRQRRVRSRSSGGGSAAGCCAV